MIHCIHALRHNSVTHSQWGSPLSLFRPSCLSYDWTQCDKIRLVGPSRCSGRVEILHENTWGTVCDDQWSISNAEVTCRELSCGTVLETKAGAFFGQGKDQIWLDDVQCSGHESSILKCLHRPFGEHNCGHGEDAGVICSELQERCVDATVVCSSKSFIASCEIPLIFFSLNVIDRKPIRVVNGTTRCSGRVEIYHAGQWGTICDDHWGMQEANVACRELDCGNAVAVKYKAFYGKGTDQVWMDDIDCTGRENALSECPHRGFGENDCDHNEDAGLLVLMLSHICFSLLESVRLINGTDRCSGRLEVFHNGQWSKICNSNWGSTQAKIVCRELECGAPQHLNVRLAEGSDACSGRVEVLSGAVWATVCDVDWTLEKAEVVCETIECGYAVNAPGEAHFNPGTGLVIDSINPCFTNKTNLQNCVKNGFKTSTCGHERDAGVVCAGIESSFIFTFLLQSRNVSHIKSYVQKYRQGY
uniref:Soluble scavenger receptor cysteine-rich domain-containing protein SSC5D n=1 Tax=Periophthalmus magnuspinnatus TaxID=409849 RepID=A0A3B4AYR2_9GOBI